MPTVNDPPESICYDNNNFLSPWSRWMQELNIIFQDWNEHDPGNVANEKEQTKKHEKSG